MKDRDYIVMLYDFYGELFHEKQRRYFEDYYFQNLSLGEISDNLGVSRNAIHKVIQGMEKKLLFYEEKLQMYSMNQKICDIIEKIDDLEIKNLLKKLV